MKIQFLTICGIAIAALFASCSPNGTSCSQKTLPETAELTKEQLMDKIKGGWAGQTIGCTYGGPTEFRFNGTMIQEYIPIKWEDGAIKWWYDNAPGLYDDVYMDLTFVDVFDRLGLDAPVDSFAMAYAHASYMLWHANQSARYNILNGIMPPASGHWKNNPHADDLDFQIEADFAGLMAPGLINSAAEVSDKIGHIMNYGDGWYGGLYVAAMYSLAFVSDDIEFIVTEALKVVPQESKYYKAMSDVIGWYKQYPNDWKANWFEIEKAKWAEDLGCPDGVFVPFNIDATVNSAYILLGLLYGEGDFGKTIDISTRAGQDSDCNPASSGGILGVILGYSNISEYWKKNIYEVEDMDFAYTTISLNKTYDMGFRQALQMVERNGGSIDGDIVKIKVQQPVPVRLEQSFEGLYPVDRENINRSAKNFGEYEFEGVGFVAGYRLKTEGKKDSYVAKVECYIDGKLIETTTLPVDFKTRKNDLFWNYDLAKGKHTISFKWLNPEPGIDLGVTSLLIYSDAPVAHTHQ